MAQKPETRFKQKVVSYFKGLGAKVFVIQQLSKRGDPDLLICLNGRFLALELKKDIKQKARPLQAHILNEVTKAGGMAFVVCPETFEATVEQISLIIVGEMAEYESNIFTVKQSRAC